MNLYAFSANLSCNFGYKIEILCRFRLPGQYQIRSLTRTPHQSTEYVRSADCKSVHKLEKFNQKPYQVFHNLITHHQHAVKYPTNHRTLEQT